MKKAIKFVILLFMSSFIDLTAGEYKAVFTASPPVIDGRLNDECWNNAPEVSAFLRTDGKRTQAQTIARICYDKNYMYLGIKCLEPEMKNIKKNIIDINGPVWADDSIELFISLDPFWPKNIQQFIINSIGTTYYFVPEINLGNGTIRKSVSVNPKSWNVEIAFPISPNNLHTGLLLSVCRERWASGPEFTYWPIGGCFRKAGGLVLFEASISNIKKRLEKIIKKDKEYFQNIFIKNYKFKQEFYHKSMQILNKFENRVSVLKESFEIDQFSNLLEAYKAERNALIFQIKISQLFQLQTQRRH